MKKFKLTLLAAQIELHWWFIKKGRRRGDKLLRNGTAYSSERFLSLNRSFSKHCAKAMKAQSEYDKLLGVSGNMHRMHI